MCYYINMKKILCICACILCLCACENNKEHSLKNVYERVYYAFDTKEGDFKVAQYENSKVVQEWTIESNRCQVVYKFVSSYSNVKCDLYEYSDMTYVIVDNRLGI